MIIYMGLDAKWNDDAGNWRIANAAPLYCPADTVRGQKPWNKEYSYASNYYTNWRTADDLHMKRPVRLKRASSIAYLANYYGGENGTSDTLAGTCYPMTVTASPARAFDTRHVGRIGNALFMDMHAGSLTFKELYGSVHKYFYVSPTDN